MPSKKRVYISGPISKGDRINHFAVSLATYKKVRDLGYAPLNPMLSMMVEFMVPATHSEWLSCDLPWVEVSDIVLRLPGESIGADMEVEHARKFSIPVVYSIEELVKIGPIEGSY